MAVSREHPPTAIEKGDGSQPRVRIASRVIVAHSPRTGDVLGQVSVATPLHIQTAFAEARLGQIAWEGIGVQRRLVFIRALRDALYRQRERIISTLMAEQGKVLAEAQFEHLAVMEMVDHYLRIGERVLAPVPVTVRLQPHRRFVIERRPYGVVLVISPWNYPLFLSVGPIVGALLAGNSVIYKPSEYATQVGEVIAAAIAEAGIPPEVFHILHGDRAVGKALIEAHPDKIAFTGSVPTGKKIARAAAEKLIPTTLELGGKDAALVLEDADIPHTARGIIWAGMFNAGQTCASVERVIVVRQVADQLLEEMKRAIQEHLLDPAGRPVLSTLAAVTTPFQIEIVETQVNEAVAGGARVIIGGRRLRELGGQFYAPTILADVTPEMRICREETFGPVVAVLQAEDEQDAIRLNNDSAFGLTASVWTRDRERGLRVARQLRVGHVSVNSHLVISGISEVPWGGVKESGYGRMHGEEGLLQMTCSQTVDVERVRLPVEPFWYPYHLAKLSLARRLVDALYGPTLKDRLRAFWR